MSAALYRGWLWHGRVRPLRHRFRYRVFTLLLDLDRLEETAAQCRLFGHNRFNLLAFHDRDHGPRDGTALRPWIEARLADSGLGTVAGGRIRVLCQPRLWGFVFDPLTVYFCDRPEGGLAALVLEVKNTFGEQHAYVLPAGPDGVADARLAKAFHVSPFNPMAQTYRFWIAPPDDHLSLAIEVGDAEGPVMRAGLTGGRRPLTARSVLAAVLAHPLMTLKVIAAIHWQALRLWTKGAPFHRKPPAVGAPR
ncbi:DUF1365 domain-containing protein [Zavarzinia sp.]|uniref:DUF1365 domain-containing protein n=1 Tax=Zavarzinia sp. TaxID=2027920 RepID=UPI0035653E9A